MKHEKPSIDMLRRLFTLDAEGGKLYWNYRPRDMFPSVGGYKMWNTRFAGKEAFTSTNKKGYKNGGIFYVIYDSHLVIWALFHGEWASTHVDHINGNKADNRIGNLRSVTNAENLKNKPRYKNNKSGFSGIIKEGGKFSARISIDGKKKRLGNFSTLQDAVAARKQAEFIHGYHDNHGREKNFGKVSA